jgi:starch phosphorylase
MTLLALNHAGYVNGVAKKHGEVSRALFPGYFIDSITNGVHSATWTCNEFAALYDNHIPGWRADPSMLRYAMNIPTIEIAQAHCQAKERVIKIVKDRTGIELRPDVFTIGFARRATEYKRATLVLRDQERLARIARANGGLQIIYAGKAHVKDLQGKELIKQIIAAARALAPRVTIVYLENYDMALAKDLVAGVDVWLNTPLKPLEASGTSGMKAAHNGVPSLSVLDGWWIEGCIEGITGWAIGDAGAEDTGPDRDSKDAGDLYEKLERIAPIYRKDPTAWAQIMRGSVALNASFFNTHRMIQEYVLRAYFQ